MDDGAVSVRVQEVWQGADQPPTQLLQTSDRRLVVGSRWVFGPTRSDDGYRLGTGCPSFLAYADAAAQRPDQVRQPRVSGGGEPGFVVLGVAGAALLLLLRLRRSWGRSWGRSGGRSSDGR